MRNWWYVWESLCVCECVVWVCCVCFENLYAFLMFSFKVLMGVYVCWCLWVLVSVSLYLCMCVSMGVFVCVCVSQSEFVCVCVCVIWSDLIWGVTLWRWQAAINNNSHTKFNGKPLSLASFLWSHSNKHSQRHTHTDSQTDRQTLKSPYIRNIH